jgi:hypothetical protein
MRKMMTELPYTEHNLALIENFLDETRKRISEGVDITFTNKANIEIQDLFLNFEIEIVDI